MRVYPNDLLLTYSSAKTRFPNKVTLTGTEGEDFDIFLGDTIQATEELFKWVKVLQSLTLHTELYLLLRYHILGF